MSNEYLKGSLGADLNDLRFQVIDQANDILERISDIEVRMSNIEKKLSFIVLPEFRTDDEDDEYAHFKVGGTD